MDDVVPADLYVRNNVDAIVLRIDERRHGLAIVDRLKEMVLANRGRHRLIFEIRTNEGKTLRMLADPEFKIALSDQSIDGLAELLGTANLSFTKN